MIDGCRPVGLLRARAAAWRCCACCLLVPSRCQGAPCSRPRMISSSIWSLMYACNARSSRMFREARKPRSSSGTCCSTRFLTAATRRSSFLSASLAIGQWSLTKMSPSSLGRAGRDPGLQGFFVCCPSLPRQRKQHDERAAWPVTTCASQKGSRPAGGTYSFSALKRPASHHSPCRMRGSVRIAQVSQATFERYVLRS